jgi:hypothetical protein
MSRRRYSLLFVVLLLPAWVTAQQRTVPLTDQTKADADFAIQGEYVGTVMEDGKPRRYGMQVAITANVGEFKAVVYRGGLPGDGWDKKFDAKTKRLVEATGQTRDGLTVFPSLLGGQAVIKDGNMTITSAGGDKLGELKRVLRQSPTLMAKPPAGAILLFDGSNLDHFLSKGPKAQMTEDRLLMIPARTKQSFTDFNLHVEFRIPYRRPNSGHSGIYLQNSYHLAVSSRSFGPSTLSDMGCGGIRWVRAPDENVCFPPLSWQTFDVDYTAARFDADGKIIKKPVVTIRHNGVVIHDQVELPETPPVYRGGGTDPLSPQGGPIHFQAHADDGGFTYRNIWVLEKKQ